MVGRIYVKDHKALLHTVPGFQRKDQFFSIISLLYGSYMLPLQPEFQFNQPLNLIQALPLPDEALKIAHLTLADLLHGLLPYLYLTLAEYEHSAQVS